MPTHSPHQSSQELRLLQLLSTRYPTIRAAHAEIINLRAILALPKGTDHYISDIHGAYEQFDHILRHASGAIRRKIAQTFGKSLTESEQVELAMLVYYPEQKLEQSLSELGSDTQRSTWMALTIARLARVARTSAQKYTRSKVRKRLDPQLAYILDELLTESHSDSQQRESYYRSIIDAIIELGDGQHVIITLAYVIHRLVVDRLNILGDIFDRGAEAEKVMDRLMDYHQVTCQWGNHDVSWMAAAAGCDVLIAVVVRMSLRYANLETLLDGYAIDLRKLARFADAVYAGDPCTAYLPKADSPLEDYTPETIARMHKAIAVIQFKLEEQTIERHPEYNMDDRRLLDHIDLEQGTLSLDGKVYVLNDKNWPTLAASQRSRLSVEEAAIIEDLRNQFRASTRLQKHIRFLYSYGNMFAVQDGNLKFHGCIPVDQQGHFLEFSLDGELLAGPPLLARFEKKAREAYFSTDEKLRQDGQDSMWYLWCGERSPLYGRLRMTTFERYAIDDPQTHEEAKGAYYTLRNNEDFCTMLLEAFGADPVQGSIINGHTPVKVRKGEHPLMAHGKLIVIDGGMSAAYQPVTGIAGYTLIGNSHELLLAAHEPFQSTEEMLRTHHDATPQTQRVRTFTKRILINDTDIGAMLHGQIEDIEKLIEAYRQGILVEDARRA